MLNDHEAQALIWEALDAYLDAAPNFEHIMDRATVELSKEQWEHLQTLLNLSIWDAVDFLDGHNILPVGVARRVCLTLDIPFDEKLMMSWQTKQEAWQQYGFYATVTPGSGVDGLQLSYHVARALGISDPPGHQFTGVGFQSRTNQQAIRQKLSEQGKL